jgi:Transcriptional regulator
LGLREDKKKKTRKAISDMATELFIQRGYHNVTTSEIAEKAEVSVPTLFNYFPTKESLVFDEDAEVEQELVDAVLKRKKGQKILEALLEKGLSFLDSIPESHKKNFNKFMALIEGTPELSLYSKQMWMRHEQALANAIRRETKVKISVLEAGSIARFVLDSYHRSLSSANSKASLKSLFEIIGRGWRE